MSDCVVWKYALPMPSPDGSSFVLMPPDALPVSVGMQDDRIVVWALVDTDLAPLDAAGPRRLIVANTGDRIHEFPDSARFLGTVTTRNGIVWHIWDADA